jgi:spore coat polysaccharide biosynthesis protein SpsF
MVNEKKVVCIVQARLTSSRLPNKVLMKLGNSGKSILEHTYERLCQSHYIDKVVFAIPDNSVNDKLEDYLKSVSIPYERGSENDVLDRFYHAAIKYNPDIVVRATCDNPLVDWTLTDRMIEALADCDYVHCTHTPLGTSSEVFYMKGLSEAYHHAKEEYEHEHVTPYLYTHPQLFRCLDLPNEGPSYRLTVDEENDFELMNTLYLQLYKGSPILNKEAYTYLENHPELASLNITIHQKLYNE